MKKVIPVILMIAGILLLPGCGGQTAASDVKDDEQPALGSHFENGDDGSGGQSVTPAEEQDGDSGAGSGEYDRESVINDLKAGIDLSLKPNEAGQIMVVMYHNIGAEEKEWTRTPANFLKDLDTLYDKGYRPVSLQDYVSGNITTEQGFTPVVITFDDGNLNNFEYLEDGQINAESAVGLLLYFHETHPDFPLEATFFLNGELPFRQKSLIHQKLSFLVENGMDVGNHTKDHNSLKKAGSEEIQEQIGRQAQYLKEALDRDDYEINALALPFGERPKDTAQAGYLAAGSFDGVSYENIAILNVGWNPAYSPYDPRFDHTSIPRVRASEMKVDNVGLYNYLDYFDRHPEERFISDGAAEIITVPEEKKESVSAVGREIYIY
ncbi:MAG TPA: polysaccharide deacetylase family protein [Anaerovoracaceae bacterium]|nr:polysaccharide deacetylase family protein [Anaerovoracaceae bacterium]